MKINRRNRKPVTDGIAKVPVIMQMADTECGAACLAMIMAYYGKWVPLIEVCAACDVSIDGSKGGNIMRAAQNYGMKAKAFRYGGKSIMKKGSFPCIIFWDFYHFVVLNGFRNGKAYLNDPARGLFTVSLEEFDKSFTGFCINLEPGETFVQDGKRESIWGFARKRMQGSMSGVLFFVLTMIIASLIGIIRPGFMRVFMDVFLSGKNPKIFVWFIIGLFLLAAAEIISEMIKAVYSFRINGKIDILGETSFLWSVIHKPMQFYAQRMPGDIQQRQEINASVSASIVNTLAPLTVNAGMAVFYLLVMFRYSLILSAFGLLSIMINLFMARIISKKRIGITRRQIRDAGRLNAMTLAGIEQIEIIKASGAENGFFEAWEGYQASVNTEAVRFARLNAYLGIIPELVSSLAGIGVLAVGVMYTMNGQFTIGAIMSFNALMTAFMNPAKSMISSGQTLQEMRTQMERINDVMEYPDEETLMTEYPDTEEEPYKLKGKVELKNVTFSYSRLGEPVLKDFSLSIEAGRRIAIAGSSGCGKSTIVKLIAGLYRPQQGEILYDGKHREQISEYVFHDSLAIVDQDVFLFEDTVDNNIRMWNESIDQYSVVLAAQDARIHDDIMNREKDYRSKLTEGGRDLSGGQKQRIEIARVLAVNPSIIILDEATSALDSKTEYEVMRSIENRNATCIIVSHRLSIIRDCDEIIVLDKGKIAERGTHQQLYNAGGIYKTLISNE